jgi:hypothetical protein
MSHYSEGQTHLLVDALEAKEFTPGQLTTLGQNVDGVLDQLKLVLLGLASVVRFCLKLALDKALNPSEFIGNNWMVWKGPVDGNGESGDEDYVPEPNIVDFEQIVLETHLQEGDNGSLHGEEKMRRARASKNRQLGDKAVLALWNDWLACKKAGKPEDSILERLRRSGKIGTVIYFFGRTLRNPIGSRYVLFLSFYGRDWHWHYGWLGGHWGSGGPSVALASVE